MKIGKLWWYLGKYRQKDYAYIAIYYQILGRALMWSLSLQDTGDSTVRIEILGISRNLDGWIDKVARGPMKDLLFMPLYCFLGFLSWCRHQKPFYFDECPHIFCFITPLNSPFMASMPWQALVWCYISFLIKLHASIFYDVLYTINCFLVWT